jgi:lipopolysaccharide/colanic/teichoic acid biosynthesis glycosyltransferase
MFQGFRTQARLGAHGERLQSRTDELVDCSPQKQTSEGDLPLVGVSRLTAARDEKKNRTEKVLKTGIDRIGAAILLLLLSPVLCFVAALVAIDGGRPIIYRRRVVGKGGEFNAFKFRTMRRDADTILATNPILKADFERSFKLKNDPRLTRLGFFLRKFSLDELPQLFNVLKGQMSLVGPRMITLAELEKYGENKELLLTVKPGITGYWQVNGRQEVSYDERVRMDMYYIRNWSLWMDIKLLLLTPLKVLRKEGAY